MGGVFGSMLALASTVLTGGSALAVGGGVASLGGASYQALEIVRSTQLDRRSPLIYAALAGTELGPTRDDRLLRRVGRRLMRLLPSVGSLAGPAQVMNGAAQVGAVCDCGLSGVSWVGGLLLAERARRTDPGHGAVTSRVGSLS